MQSPFIPCKPGEKPLRKRRQHLLRASVTREWSGVGNNHRAVQCLQDMPVLLRVVTMKFCLENMARNVERLSEIIVGNQYSSEQADLVPVAGFHRPFL